MNNELLVALEYLERERGINKSILVEAVESALISAVKKSLKNKTGEIKVELDSSLGIFKVLVDGHEIKDAEFGRIAAQTAKQVIIQKIKEAERDIAFDEFEKKKGNIVNGSVHRFDKDAIILDLGKTEGILPKKEQLRKEIYHQGDRLKALVIDVKRTNRGPQIILSRTDDRLVKVLFELEVPEIFEGIVEVKAIAREPGERTKIAVYSRDKKIDSVGACVGMRGSRVKNIVQELQGEKIDIIKWDENTEEYVKAALNPAKISEIKVDEKNKKIKIIVEDDQLSLTIGKHGQNVRLASKLVGYDIGIKSYSESRKEKSAEDKKIFEKEEQKTGLKDLAGIGGKIILSLEEAGYDTLEKIRAASIEDLTKVKGIGAKTAQKILTEAKKT